MSDELDRIARAAAPEVLAAALDRARERAVERLADLLSDAIVARALTAPGLPAPQPAAPQPAEPDPLGPAPDGLDEALYAYGISWADAPLPDGVEALTENAALRKVVRDDLALLVSAVRPDQLRVDEDDLSESGRLAMLARGHDTVVRAAAGAGPVLPLRFGTVVPDDAAAQRLLHEHGTAAREQLSRIGDTREWGVKLVRRLAPEPTDVGARARERSGVTGTEYLTRRRHVLEQHDAVEAAAERAADLLDETLRPHVAESLRRGGSPGSSLLLDLALLVAPADEAGFLSAAAGLRDRLEPDGLEVEVTGPWPPYSFAALRDGDDHG
jgi:hypothetical protein